MGNICRFQKKCCNDCLRVGMTVSHTINIHWLVRNDIVSSVQWIWVWLCILYCVKHKAYQQAAKAVKASFINGTVGPADCAQYDLRQQSCMHDTWTHNWSSMQLKTPTDDLLPRWQNTSCLAASADNAKYKNDLWCSRVQMSP